MTATQRHYSGRTVTAVRTRKHAIVLLVASTLLVLAGCSDNGPDSSSSKASPTEPGDSASPSPAASTQVAAAIAAYTRSWDAQTEAYSKASSAGTGLKKNTTFKALADIEKDLAVMRKAGQVTTGKPAISPKVVKVTDAKIPTATVTDCVDTTHWVLIDKASKKPVPLPTTRLIKYVSTATLEKWGTKWMVTKLTAQEQSC
ncbi:hypothetical protein ACIBL8_46130 [Streptomyces sp. NPDC050523]|uniref:hypothetical protein n=1 Tax=Streptomyces sp. NPDC050523 TaxID=3365622 RepID=UPI00378D01E4